MNAIEKLFPVSQQERSFQLKVRRDAGTAAPGWVQPQFVECKKCGRRATRQVWTKSLYVCPNCGVHLPIGAYYRLSTILDHGTFKELNPDLAPNDVLHFPDYQEKLAAASGKTGLGIELALTLGGEVISADSMQIYRGMDIGTAKPTPEEMQGVPHHMIDIADPAENYSVSRYAAEAAACVDDILARGKLPIVVGGTGLYIDSLIAGRTFADGTADTALRQELSERYDEIGGEGLLGELRKVDPERAARLHPADKKRIVRAMEVYILTGRTITQHDAETRAVPPRYDAAKIALDFADRRDLYDRIDRRVELMVRQGLFDEVRALLAAGVPADCTAMQAIGYKEAVAAVRGEATPQEAVAAIQLASRRYAKRQLTWLRRDRDLFWLRHEKTPDMDRACRLSTQFLSGRGIE